jgi:multimeric flavodoxin WrbA
MIVLTINGSPRRGGNTEILLERAIAGARAGGAEVEKVILNELNFVGCQDCGGCEKDGICVQKDDLEPVYEKIKTAERLIFASPIFFGSLTSQSKKLIDRMQAFWIAKNVLDKKVGKIPLRKGIFLCVQASQREGFFKNAKGIIKNFFATAEFSYAGEVLCSGADKKESILRNKACLEKAYNLARELVIAK